jgi:hypothetical protein
MKKIAIVVVALLTVATSVAAQGKVTGKLSCAKPDVNSMAEVGDAQGHMLMLQKTACTWPTPWDVGGSKSKSAVDVSTAEVHGLTGTSHGYNTTTLDNGDKVTVSYEGKIQMKQDQSGTGSGTWRFVSGTGKAKGIKGSGTYKATAAADGSGMVDVNGNYTIPASAAKPEPAKKKP